MTALDSVVKTLRLASLSETRQMIRPWRARLTAVFFAILFAFTSMLVGGMLIFARIPGGYTSQILWGNALGQRPWNYPGVLIVAPWGVLSLPFLATVTMVLVSAGVGVSVTVAITLLLPTLRRRPRVGGSRSAVAGAGIGSSPAITGLATLGACCCGACATGGIAVVAAASGVSLYELLRNNWYISVFELAVVYIAMVAQERNLRQSRLVCPVAPRLDRRVAVGMLLRVGLLVAGITWSLAMFVEWGSTDPVAAPPAMWYHWIFEHQLLSITAMAAGMFPREFTSLVRSFFGRLSGGPWRVGLFAAALTWGTWVPPALARAGLGGFLNELMGYLGAPASMGAVAPSSPLGAVLLFHWAFQHLLLASFGLGLALSPERTTVPLLWSVGEEPATIIIRRGTHLTPPADYTS